MKNISMKQVCLSSNKGKYLLIFSKQYKTKKFDTKAEQWRTEQVNFWQIHFKFWWISLKAKSIKQYHWLIWIQNKTSYQTVTGWLKRRRKNDLMLIHNKGFHNTDAVLYYYLPLCNQIPLIHIYQPIFVPKFNMDFCHSLLTCRKKSLCL